MRRATIAHNVCYTVEGGISIHALREEGDAAMERTDVLVDYFYPRPPRGGRLGIGGQLSEEEQFLSTPSARRATGLCCLCGRDHRISIHALREEGDEACSSAVTFS